MTTPLTVVASERPDGTPVLAVTGEIDMSNAGVLDDALTTSTGDGALLVDLSGVEYLDSAGLTVLFAHAARIRVLANPVITPVLTISGLTEVTTVE
ncbi:anti-anti-sigma factor [Sphaerisporangium krabiense]|uniref:Anti-anti-sigma factor n=1 Tax=Sphaerisporangium krabiense TaxID=763782 RepID=A0A7W8ZC83_9ACTN|nr:STAS domain-containing protein [Sphaerisporangium krabiense]MBB5631351.1 anti-anti-sigma factor [Sphaerisporangium krabiense]GII60768.1 anti-anti-sigma factor [Sphaerisporangium krabiense]